MIYIPIHTLSDFEERIIFGSTKESIHLDFKAQFNTGKPEDYAIDITAFANAYGGTLLFGIAEKTEGGLTFASGICPGLQYENLRKHLNNTVRDYIRPSINFETHQIDTDKGIIAAVNIEPSINLVGACTNKEQQSYCFPIRTEFGNRYLDYSEAEKRMNENLSRRNYLKMLSHVGKISFPKEVQLFPKLKCNLDIIWQIEVLENSDNEFVLSRNNAKRICIPYSFINEIWKNSKDVIVIRLNNQLVEEKDIIVMDDDDMSQLSSEAFQKTNEGFKKLFERGSF